MEKIGGGNLKAFAAFLLALVAGSCRAADGVTDSCTVTSDLMVTLLPWLVVGVLGAIVVISYVSRCSWNSKRKTPEPDNELPKPEASTPPIFEGTARLLDGEWFHEEGTDLFQLTQKAARDQANRFMAEARQRMEQVSAPKDFGLTKEEFQRIAERLDQDFVGGICSHESPWMKRVFIDREVPVSLPDFIRRLLPPIQVPSGAKVQLEVAPWAVALLSALGALMGAGLAARYVSFVGMKGPSDTMVLIGATLGTSVITSLVFWLTSHESWRKKVELAIVGVGFADVMQTSLSSLLRFSSFFGSKKTVQGGIWSRIAIYISAFLMVRLMKRPVTFSEADYCEKLEHLYFERIQSVVVLAALCYLHDNAKMKWIEREIVLNERIKEQEAIIRELEEINRKLKKFPNSIFPKIQSFWTLDIRKLGPHLRALASDFRICGYDDLPWDKKMVFLDQLDQIMKGEPLDKIPRADVPEPKILIWVEEMAAEYKAFGDPMPGDRVEELEAPIRRNGQIETMGLVQCLE